MNLDTVRIRIDFECVSCGGAGKVHDPCCARCHNRLTPVDLEAGVDAMPCGHSWRFCVEEPICAECEGSGRQVEFVSLGQLASWMAMLERES
jgi:hypothetical protein